MSPSPHQEIVPRKHASGPGPSRLDISPLPSLQTFRLVYRALADQNLPPLPTTTLHGALGHALKEIGRAHV